MTPGSEKDWLEAQIARLREENEFLKSFLQNKTAHMDGNHVWRFTTDWRTKYLVGNSREHAVYNAIKKQKSMDEFLLDYERYSRERSGE